VNSLTISIAFPSYKKLIFWGNRPLEKIIIQERNVCGLDCISDEIEGEFDIYLKLFVLLYADDTVLFSDSDIPFFKKLLEII
jgi:hypothetical protein